MTATTFAALVDHLGGFLHDGDIDRAWTPDGLLYVGFNGAVKLDHHGRVHRLGRLGDGTGPIVAAYRAATGVEAGAA